MARPSVPSSLKSSLTKSWVQFVQPTLGRQYREAVEVGDEVEEVVVVNDVVTKAVTVVVIALHVDSGGEVVLLQAETVRIEGTVTVDGAGQVFVQVLDSEPVVDVDDELGVSEADMDKEVGASGKLLLELVLMLVKPVVGEVEVTTTV
jgi:hypothetical protein